MGTCKSQFFVTTQKCSTMFSSTFNTALITISYNLYLLVEKFLQIKFLIYIEPYINRLG